MQFKFAHLSDCHLGAWRKESLNEVGYNVFQEMVDRIIQQNVDFLLICGDLYDTSNPKVDVVDLATKELKRLADENIPVYGIMGSHDFSPSNKSMIRPLISAKLFTDVFQGDLTEDEQINLNFVEDPKTRIKLTGVRARKRGLELNDFRILNRKALEKKEGKKIFLLHTMLTELKPKEYKDMMSGPKSLLPRDFLYYAGGHIHQTIPRELRTQGEIKISPNMELNKKVIYPGCLSPRSFRELEKFHYGGYCLVKGNTKTGELTVKFEELKEKEVFPIHIDGTNKSVRKVKQLIEEEITTKDVQNKIITVRIKGKLAKGKSYEIKVNEIVKKLKDKGAFEVLVNKAKLTSHEYKAKKIKTGETTEEIEERTIKEHIENSKIGKFSTNEIAQKVHKLIEILGREPAPGTKKKDFKREYIDSFLEVMEINQKEGKNN
jgi:DNA repair exonuclease SbcCD nuclease subunit